MEEFISNIDKIHGWCTIEKCLKIQEIIEKYNLKFCVELGVFGGKSLIAIALSLKNNGKVIGIDAWDKNVCLLGENDIKNNEWWQKIDYEYFYNYTIELIKEYNCDQIVEIWRNTSENVYDKFENESIDFLHIDANHSESESTKDVTLYAPKIKINGFILLDDTDWITTKNAQDLLTQNLGFDEIFDSGKYKIYQKVKI